MKLSSRSGGFGCGLLAVILLAATAGASAAAEVSLSLGRNDILDRHGDTSFAVGLGVSSDQLASLGPVGFAVGGALEVSGSGEFWAGAGPIALIPFGDLYHMDASVMIGVYEEGEGFDLGFPMEIRSRLGLSRKVAGDWRVGLAIEHKSNAGAGQRNPGIETLFATVSHSF